MAGCVTPGYFGNLKQTQSSFDKEGYFLTGDLGFVGEDGRIYYRGRLKEMIKTGGINVAPLEIENILMRYPKTKQAFVFGIPDAIKDEKIIAVLEIKDKFELDANALKNTAEGSWHLIKSQNNLSYEQTNNSQEHQLER